MTRKRITLFAIVGAMFIIGAVLLLGDVGKGKKVPSTSSVSEVAMAVRSTGAVATISGQRASCDTISDWQQKRQRDLISISPVFERLNDVPCDSIIPFSEDVELDVGDLQVGTYTIDVLGTTSVLVLSQAITSFDFSNFSDASFQQFGVVADTSVKKASLDTAALVQYASVEALNALWNKASVNAADHLAVLTIACGTSCQKSLVVDISTGKLVQAFDSQFGVVTKAGSLLLIVNNPTLIKASGATDPIVAEAYLFNPDTRSFDFLAQGDYLFGELHQ